MSSRRRTVEVDSLEDFDRRVASGATSLEGWVVQDLDLRQREQVLERLRPRGALFLGGRFGPGVEESLRSRGALVFPSLPDVPVDVYRARLYTPEELYDGLAAGTYEATLDARAFAWAGAPTQRPSLRDMLARTLHDLSVEDALQEFVDGRRLVGVMGGHAATRGSAGYHDAVRLGGSLTRAGLTVATGGGPGAMEAANLGAHLADQPPSVVAAAVGLLAQVPDFRPSISAWARAGLEVRRRWPDGRLSLGVPTWFYGHEPPNVFAGAIAKLFGNAVREDLLLHVCRAGTVFLPGAAGTVQEVFQEACENYYAEADGAAPMVLVGVDYWTQQLPVWPLLTSLARGRGMERSLHLVDDLDTATDLLAGIRGRDSSRSLDDVTH